MTAKFWLTAAGIAVCAALTAAPAAVAAPLAGPAAVTAATAAGAESASWAGYYLSGASGAFSSVSASWTVPAAACTSGSQDADFWVGLDGVSSDSVEQIGLEADCASGSATYFGWYEMYPANPVIFSNVIGPGDALSASVTVSGTKTYTLVLADATQCWTKTVTKSQAGLARSSAEIVTSGPGAAGGSPTLTDFGKVTFSQCMVNGASMGTQSPVKVTMVDDKGNVMVAPGPMTSAGKFTNTWERGN
jgi:hypothetical protein